jgi:hypothetical protein
VGSVSGRLKAVEATTGSASTLRPAGPQQAPQLVRTRADDDLVVIGMPVDRRDDLAKAQVGEGLREVALMPAERAADSRLLRRMNMPRIP